MLVHNAIVHLSEIGSNLTKQYSKKQQTAITFQIYFQSNPIYILHARQTITILYNKTWQSITDRA